MTAQEMSLIQPIIIFAIIATGVLLLALGVGICSYIAGNGHLELRRAKAKLKAEKLQHFQQMELGQITYTPKAEKDGQR